MSEPQHLDGDATARGLTNENELRTFTVEFEIGDNYIEGLDIDSVMDDIHTRNLTDRATRNSYKPRVRIKTVPFTIGTGGITAITA